MTAPDAFATATSAAALGKLARQLAGFLTAARADTRAPYAARALHRAFDTLAARLPPREPLACRAGCNYCCHQVVSARAAEIFLLARTVRALPAAEATALAGRVADAAAATAAMDVAERHRRNVPCPLLVDGRCAVYADRPLACRAFASHDVEACRRAFAHEPATIPVPRTAMALRAFVTTAAEAAARSARVPDDQYELIGGLALALADPQTEARWQAGEDVLAPAAARRLLPR